ncbi:MAG: glycosyltransferase family 39 protein [Chloroflexota bacterium]|nr:glycosyltransferase family 39 protein [Chloroflexota bacterium]
MLISVSRIGFVHDMVGLSWGPPGTPISFAQVNLVFAISLVLMFAVYIIRSRIPKIHAHWLTFQDIIIFTGLWALAVVLWWNQPMSPTHFAPAPIAPNNEYYPHSDAAIFDRSSYHLIHGAGFSNHLARRPLYVGMLGLFHKIAGPNYEDTVFLQIIVLALIPSLIYLLTSKLSNRLAGLIAGGMILLREKNAIEFSGEIVTSHAKLMMSDLVATLGVIVIIYLCVKLFIKQDRDKWMLAIIGASLGLTALVRAQVLVLVPFLFIYIIIARRSIRLGIRDFIPLFLGLALTLAPWVIRNWNLTGSIVLDDGGELRLLARNYSSDPVNLPEPLTGESQKEFSARLTQGILSFVLEHPRDVLFFVSNHFFHNLATSAVYIAPIYSTGSTHSLVGELPFWGEWNGELTGASGAALVINLVIVAFGIGIAQAKYKSAGWIPITIFLVYSLGNALVRSSGWRFSLPVDWVIVMYYGIALAYIPSVMKYLLVDKNISSQPISQTSPASGNPFIGVAVFFLMLLLGASISVAERLIPARDFANYTEDARKSLVQEGFLTSSEIEAFLEQEKALFVSGLALYPRYFRPNSRFQLADIDEQYRYLHFWMINKDDEQVVLPLQNHPDIFPHASTVSVIGCMEDNSISAWAIVMHTPSKRILIREPQSPLICPLVEPN